MTADPYDAKLMASVFDYSKITDRIRTEALGRMVSPWTLLGGALTRAALATPYTWRLPAIVEDDASLNQLIVHAGASGSGKGAGKTDIFAWPDTDPFNLDDGEQRLEEVFHPITVASGEAFGSLFVETQQAPDPTNPKRKVTVTARIRHAAWADFDEVDQFTAMGNRIGATLSAEIRKVWSGSGIGTYTKNKANRATVRAHAYRLVVTVGAQPLRCGPLLAEEAGGTLQRCLWLSADMPEMDDADDTEPGTRPLGIVLPDFGHGITSPGQDGPVHYFGVAPEVRAEIRRDRRTTHWKDADAHRNLVRLKAAAACAVLHGSTDITPEIWEWAGAVVEHSVRVRASVRSAIGKANDEKRRRRAADDSLRATETAAMTEMQVENVAAALLKKFRESPKAAATLAMLKRTQDPDRRPLVPQAVKLLEDRGQVTKAEPTRQRTETWRLSREP